MKSLPKSTISRPMLSGVLAIALSMILAACSHFGTEKTPAPPKGDARAQLSIGYSLLYQEAKGIPKLQWLLMFKQESSEMAQMTDDLVGYYQHLADSMERLSRQYPAMRIDAKAMSRIEEDTRKAIGTDQAKEMAPIAGKSGTAFEREALLMFYDALNEQRHLTGVMAGEESNPGLREFLESTRAQLDERHAKVGALLERRYFTH